MGNPNIPDKVVIKHIGFPNEKSYNNFRNIVKLMIVEDIKRELVKDS
jgi:hypothetical protein